METDMQKASAEVEPAREVYLLGRSLFAQGRYDEARTALMQAAEVLEGYADIHHYLGVIAHLKTEFKEAIEHFRRALAVNPRYTEAMLNLAITYNTVGLYEKAAALFQSAAESSSSSSGTLPPHIETRLANLHSDIGSIYHDHFVYDRAINEFRQALELCPHFVDIRFKLGLSLRDSGKLELAAEEFQAALRFHPRYHAAQAQFGFCLLKLGRADQARAEFQAVLAQDPENTLASVGISMLEGDTGPNEPEDG